MPQIQMIDTTPRKQEPTQVEEFFSKLTKHIESKKDEEELAPLWAELEKNKEKQGALVDFQNKVESNPRISPSKRLQINQHVNERRKLDIEESKVTNTKLAAAQAAQANRGKEYSKLREKAVSEYTSAGLQEGEKAAKQKYAIQTSRKAVNSGNVSGPGWEALVKANPYANLIKGYTTDEATLVAANKELLEGTKGLFGSKPTEREIFLLLHDLLPSVGKTKEANNASLDVIEHINDMKALKAEIIDKLTRGGSEYVPDLEARVNQAMQPYADALLEEMQEIKQKYGSDEGEKKAKIIKMKAPNGKYIEGTQQELDAAIKAGAKLEPVK